MKKRGERSVKKGDKVRMDTSRTGWLGTEIPDLGVGTVTATTEGDDEFLMTGMYVGVTFDHGYERVAIGALAKED